MYVGEQLQKALQPCITNVNVKWNLGVNVENAPKQTPPVYLNDRLIVYALTNDKTIPFDHNSSVELQIEPDHRSIGVAKVNQIPNVAENETIARLAAKALILELQHAKLPSSSAKKMRTGSTQARFQGMTTSNEEKMEVDSDEKTIKQHIIELSLKYNILSPHTAFVGIEKRTNASNAEMVLREVPIEISADDRHLLSPLSGFHSSVGSRGRGGYGLGAGGAVRHRKVMNMNAISLSIPTSAMNFLAPACLTFSSSNFGSEVSSPRIKSSSKKSTSMLDDEAESESTLQNNEVWPSTDQDIVRYLINKQKFDGLWDINDDIIKNLTGKSLSVFRSTNPNINDQILVSAIIIIMLETKFAGFSSLWHGVVQKARKRMIDLVKKDSNSFDTLIENIRKQL